jgi:hypothetical protein
MNSATQLTVAEYCQLLTDAVKTERAERQANFLLSQPQRKDLMATWKDAHDTVAAKLAEKEALLNDAQLRLIETRKQLAAKDQALMKGIDIALAAINADKEPGR